MDDTRDQVVASLQEKGWTREQALGIAANLQAESRFNPAAVGDGGRAYGIAQWHPDRQAEFKKRFGKAIQGSTLDEQVDFLDHELRAGREQSAGRRLMAATTAADAARITSMYYERPADRDGEAAKRAALAVSFGGAAAAPAVPVARGTAKAEHDDGWPMLPTARAARTAATGIDPNPLLASSVSLVQAANNTADASRAALDASIARDAELEAQKQATGVGAAFDAARHDPRIQIMFNVLDRFNEDDGEVPPGWTYAAVQDEVEAGRPDDEREFLRENGTSPAAVERAKAQLEYRRDLDRTYGLAGGLASFVGQMGGGIMDPVGLAAGLGVGKALQLAGVGSHALANAGRVGLARGAFVGENILGNVAIEGMQDALGEVKGSGDYAMAAAMGAVMSTPFLPLLRDRTGVVAETEAVIQQTNADVTQKAGRQQADAVAAGLAEGKSPTEAARAAEQAEIDSILGETQQGPRLREQAIPDDVQADLRAELAGADRTGMAGTEPAQPAPKAAEPDVEPPPNITQPAPERTPEQVAQAVADGAKGKGNRVVGVTKEGEEVRLEWVNGTRQDKAGDSSLRATLTGLMDTAKNLPDDVRKVYSYLLGSLSNDLLDRVAVRMTTGRGSAAGSYNAGTGLLNIASGTAKSRRGRTSVEVLAEAPAQTHRVVAHEALHSATQIKLLAYQSGELKGAALQAAKNLDKYFQDFKAKIKGTNPGWELKYAAKDIHEFVSQAWSEQAVQEVLASMPGNSGKSGLSGSLWGKVVKSISDMLFAGKGVQPSALVDVMRNTDALIRAADVQYLDANGVPTLYAQLPPQVLHNARRKRLEKIVNHAMAYMTANPIRPERLKTLTRLTERFGGVTDGLVMASSKNPVVQMVASLVTEVTTGAAGRRSTVAVKTEMLRNQLIGNGLVDYQNARARWHAVHKTSMADRVLRGDADRAFGRAVMIEIRRRADPAYVGQDPHVVAAADALQAGFQRSADMQRMAGTLGSDALDINSRGYVPQALDGVKLQALANDPAAYQAFTKAIAKSFVNDLGFDQKFANLFAQQYLDRVRVRAMGDKSMDGLAAAGDGMQVVRDTLAEMGQDVALRDRAAAAAASIGPGHTKKRLNIDLLQPFGDGLLLDYYVTDPVALYRRYQHGSAGNIALTESGILGTHGIRELRAAATQPLQGAPSATKPELEAMDRVFAEIMGTPVAGEVISSGATNLGLIVGLQRLGGLVFTQASEMWNMLHHVGLGATLRGASRLPALIAEVRESHRGQIPKNSMLQSLEVYGGDIGMQGYKMVMPLDAPDMHVSQYMEQPSVLTRLLRAGGHVQAVATGFRALLAAQHRMAAEQVTMKALRFIRDGKDSKALADMGFTPEVVAAVKADLPNIAQWDANGRLVSLDISKVSDPATAESFVQAVHRGTAQIIQGTFVGERNKWVHNDYVRLMMQLRTFGMTAMEKQWSRTRMNQGFYSATALLVAQMGLALPLHLARVQLAAAGREDRQKYLKDNTSAAALVRATMNYSSLSGLTGDVLEITSGIIGGWGDQRTKELVGARQQATSVGRIVPFAGTIDTGARVLSGKTDLHTAIKQLPFSSIWYLAPLINLTKEK